MVSLSESLLFQTEEAEFRFRHSRFAGLPRVLEDTLPEYLSVRGGIDSGIQAEGEQERLDWTKYGEYLERGARININLRSGTKGDA